MEIHNPSFPVGLQKRITKRKLLLGITLAALVEPNHGWPILYNEISKEDLTNSKGVVDRPEKGRR